MKIVLDNSLNTIPLREVNKNEFILSMTDRKYNYKDRTYVQTLFPVRHSLEENISAIHRNYLEYLELCWAKHYGVVVTPDIIWYMLLCEVAQLVSENPEQYRELFTNSADKQEITVMTGDPEVLPLGRIMDELRLRVPAGFTDVFLDDFSTTTIRARSAKYAAFADVVSPYYSYNMMMCGIPFVLLAGNYNDWNDLMYRWFKICDKLSIDINYSQQVGDILLKLNTSFIKIDLDFWKDIFYAEKCGSGSETEIYGWVTKLFRNQPENVRKACNFSSHISNVKYKNLDTGLSYQMKQGLFYSIVESNLLKPDFAMVVLEDKGVK